MGELIKIRKHLHAYPELSGHEANTSQFIADYLQKLGINKTFQRISHHTLLTEISGKNPGPTILFRCEMDALPIEEINNVDYRSQTTGISHGCGHDGHMAIMLGLAQELLLKPPDKGKILLLFQSAEETGQGAQALLHSGFLNHYNISFAFSLHNMPGYDLGDVICKTGNFTPAVESLCIDILGKTSHAGEPEKGTNPASTIAGIITFLNSLQEPDRKQKNYFLATPIQIQMGEEAFGTSAGNAHVKYTFRAWSTSYLEQKKREIEERLHEICKKERGLVTRLSWSESFKATINHSDAYRIIEKAATANKSIFINKEEPLVWGEDFGLLTEKIRGALFGMGSGKDCPALHNPDYNFPDDLICIGVKMLSSIAEEILQ